MRTVARVEAHDHLASTFGGYTRIAAKGAWRTSNGSIVHESSIIYEVLTDSDSKDFARKTAETLARLCSQQSVLYTVEEVQGGFT